MYWISKTDFEIVWLARIWQQYSDVIDVVIMIRAGNK